MDEVMEAAAEVMLEGGALDVLVFDNANAMKAAWDMRRAVPEAQKVTADRKKKEAGFLTEAAVDAAALKAAIDATGYTCLGVESAPYEKKGLFRWK